MLASLTITAVSLFLKALIDTAKLKEAAADSAQKSRFFREKILKGEEQVNREY